MSRLDHTMTPPTRLPGVTAASADATDDPITVEVEVRGADGREYLMVLTCGTVQDIAPDTDRALEALDIDGGLNEWRPLS